MAILNGESLRAAAKRRTTKDVEVEGLGTVRLRSLSAGDALKFQAEVRKCQSAGGDPEELAPALIARSWVGEDGELLMPEDEGAALARELEPKGYNALALAVLTLNGLTEEAVKDAEKNSEASPSDSTPSGSPEPSDTPTSI